MLNRTRLYALDFESFAIVEDILIDLYLKTDDVAMKKAIVSVVASGILACDVMEMVRKIQGGRGSI